MNTNTTTTATKQINAGDLELIYADFEVAKTFIEGAEHFFNDVRAWLNYTKCPDYKLMIEELCKGDTMLSESKHRLDTGMKQLNKVVEQAYGGKGEGQ